MGSYVRRLRGRLAACPSLDVPFLALLLLLSGDEKNHELLFALLFLLL